MKREKRKLIFSACALCLVFAFALTGCGVAADSSSDPFAAFSESKPAASSSAPRTDSGSKRADSSSSKKEKTEQDYTRRCFVSLPVQRTNGTTGPNGLVIVDVPDVWTYDDIITFSRDGVKFIEVPSLWQAGGGDEPFTAAMTDPYQNDDTTPEGFGLVSTEDTTRNGHMMRLLHLKIWMADADAPSWMHCVFYKTQGYIVETRLYTDEEWGKKDSDALLAVLDSLSLHFSDDMSIEPEPEPDDAEHTDTPSGTDSPAPDPSDTPIEEPLG